MDVEGDLTMSPAGGKETGPRRTGFSFLGKRKPAPSRAGGRLAVQSHHRLAIHHGQKPKIEPAPGCFPPNARVPLTVFVKGWRDAIQCSVVRIDEKSKQILVALPDEHVGRHHASSGDQAVIGWPDHDVWHETKTAVAGKIKPGSRYIWLRVAADPIHHERRRFVRAKQVRPIAIHKGRTRVEATTMDMSEAALRMVMDVAEPVHSGDKVHMMFPTPLRFKGQEAIPVAIDGHVYRTRELGEGKAGRKEVVIFFENLTPAQQDFIRGIVYDLHLRDKRPIDAEEE